MSDDSQELVSRFISSMDEYFKDIPVDRLLAFAINPVLAKFGSVEIEALLGDTEGPALVAKAKQQLKKLILKVLRTKLEKETQAASVGGDAEDAEDDDDGKYMFI